MDETLLLPSPNWFLVTGMAVSSDGWLFYGGPSKSLCVLEPLTPDFNGIIMDRNCYRAHVFQKSHKERIVSVDVSPKWPETQCVITGSADGAVKEWLLEKLDRALSAKSLHAHSIHSAEHEEVIGVGYATASCAITVGSYGRIVKWDLKSNIVKPYTMIFSKFKPSCMALSPHAPYHVAVGTKQGVVLVVNVADAGAIVYKVRSHDEEIQSLSWCPQPQVIVRKFLKDTEKTQPQTQSANIRMERIRQEAELEESEQLNKSGVAKTLPEDSFDETVVEEDDMFDIYTDHADDEFGHRKYKPEVITVKVKEENEEDLDFLAKCQKLKEDILRVKNEPEPSIQSLVDAFEKSGLDDDGDDSESKVSESKPKKTEFIEHRSLPNKYLLASVGKNGTLRIWSKNGKMVGNAMINNAAQKYQHQKSKQPMWASLFWYKADVLLMTDAKGQLLQCNPLEVDWKSKLHCTVVEALHRRGVYCVISNAPRVQNPPQNSQQEQAAQTQTQNETENKGGSIVENAQSLSEDKWLVWTAAQDRYITCYSMEQKKKISCFNTCGGIPYTIQACPYDARKVAFSVGDGAVRVWEADISDEDENKIKYGNVTTYWQNVQGRVLTIAWHPTKENILAYGTAESRVGILDVSGNTEKPGRVINMGIAGSVYSLSWGDRNELYACGSEDIVMQRYDKKNSESTTLPVVFEGQTWKVTSVKWFPAGLMCGSLTGSVALLDSKTYEILAINFVFKKMIHSIEWHPQFTSSSSEESQFKDLIAVSAVDKNCNIAILKYSEKEDGTKQLDTHMFLEGHKGSVFQLAWNPHIEGQLLSSAQDNTARVWDVSSGACTAIFAGHGSSVNGVAWSPWPQLGSVALSGGGDCCVRAWRPCDHPPELYQDNRPDKSNAAKRERKKKAKLEEAEEKSKLSEESHDFDPELDGEEAELMDASNKPKISKKFLLPITTKQIGHCTPQAVRRLAEKYCNLQPRATDESESEYDMDFIKLFGTINEVNELLDLEMNNHLEKKNYDAWIMLAIFRGQIDDMIQFASKHDLLCPFLVSIAPSVSFKYWKDVTALYIAQIDRFIAQKTDHKLVEPRHFGGAVFNKVAMLLSAHDVRGAARCLAAAGRPRDAYALCRVRHMDSIAEEILWKWTHDSLSNGWPLMTTICYIVLGETYKASTTIAGMSNESESWLSLAADLAKASGQHTYAGHLEDKKEQIKINPKDEEIEQTLQQLPSRMELLLKKNENNTSNESVTDNKIQVEGANVKIEMKNGTTDVDSAETKE